jgi:hypothetical protein
VNVVKLGLDCSFTGLIVVFTNSGLGFMGFRSLDRFFLFSFVWFGV